MYYCKTLLIAFMLLPFYLFAQTAVQPSEITGLWTGTLYNDSAQLHYKYEVVINKKNQKYQGYSHTWFVINHKEYFAVKKVKVKIAKDGKVIVVDDGIIAHNLPELPEKYSKQLNVLALNHTGNTSTLNGIFVTKRTKKYLSLTGQIKLDHSQKLWQSDLIAQLKNLHLENDITNEPVVYNP